jgi:hypothetical protein
MSRRGAGVAFCIFGTLITPGLIQYQSMPLVSSQSLPVGWIFILAGVIYLIRAEAAERGE